MPFNIGMQPSDIFHCTKCGECCKGYGGTVVTQNDVESVAAFLKKDPSQFITDYCQVSGGKLILGQGADKYCLFWDGRCRIHPVKPRMCRAWPFIESILRDISNWQMVAASCPGIRSDIPDRTVKDCVRKVLKTMH